MNDVLVLEKISKSFSGVKALSDMSFSIRTSEVHAICGENGAGKSTLMKVVSGVYNPDSGRIIINGEEVHISNPNDAFQKGISIIYQETSLFAEMTILENMFLNHEMTTKWLGFIPVVDYKSMTEKIENIFTDLNCNLDLNSKVKNISMAEKQLVEIAKALTFDAKILIMDEPTASLTQVEVNGLFQIIKKLQSHGVSIVYISHRLEEIFEICDRVTVIRDGQFISCNDVKNTNKDKLVADMVGRPMGKYYPKEIAEIGDVVLEIEDICQSNLLKNVNLNIKKSEIVGLAGLTGAGRTELAHAICGITTSDSGSVILNGKNVKIKTYMKSMEEGIVYVTEDRIKYGLVYGMSIKQNITLPQVKKLSNFMFVNGKIEEKISSDLIDKFSIKTPNTDFIVDKLSGGNQQKVSVARAVSLSPKILILDEPTRGVDVSAKAEIHKLISTLVKGGMSILMISSELPELLGMCDRIYVMKDGEVVSCFNREEATQEKILAIALGTQPVEVTSTAKTSRGSNEI
jgi:ABC-type sugar transport system ATPase subunit